MTDNHTKKTSAPTRFHPTCILLLVTLLISACGSQNGPAPADDGLRYYIDASNGNDLNNGLSPSTSWKTLARIGQQTFSGPVVVSLKSGETWHESLTLHASDITLNRYDSGALPILDGSAEVGAWTDDGGGRYYLDVSLANGQALGNISENGTMMSFLSWQVDANTTFASAAAGTYSYDWSSGRIFIFPAQDPALNIYRISRLVTGITAKELSGISISDIEIRRFSLHGIQFNRCIRCNADNVTISRVGGAVVVTSPTAIYAGNGIEYANTSSSGRIENVSVSEVFDSCLTVQTFESGQTASNFTFSGASLDRCGFAGIELSVLDNGGTSGSMLQNISLSDQQISDTGKGWSGRRYGTEGHGIRIKADAGAGMIDTITIERSQISRSAGSGIYLGGETEGIELHRIESAHNDESGMQMIDASATRLEATLGSSLIHGNGAYGVTVNAPSANDLQIYHTTFHDNTPINLAVFGAPSMLTVENNLFSGNASITDIYAAAMLSNTLIDHNCYEDQPNMFGYDGSAYAGVAAFTAATGFESNGTGTGSIALNDPGAGDFTLAATSSCIGLGTAGTGVSEDYNSLPFSEPPDSGAFVYR